MKFIKNVLSALIGCFLAFGLIFIVMMGMMTALVPSEEPMLISESSILRIDLKSTIGEQTVEDPFDLSSILPSALGSTASNTLGILDAVNAIDAAAQDPNIKFIYITNCSYGFGTSYLEEVRNALVRFRNSGKAIIAYGDNFSQGGYYIASVADKIYADGMANAQITGISTTIFFLKDILNYFGAEMQLIRHGKYKSAGEQYIASNISDANREQQQAMIDAMWEAISNDICKSRGISEEKFNKLVDNLDILSAEGLLAAGLIDKTVTITEMENILTSLAGKENIDDINMVSLSDYAGNAVKTDFKVKDKIAIIYADGQINTDPSQDGITYQKFVPEIQKIRKDSTIKAVVLRVNSPGGAANTAETIRKELELLRAEKPVIVSYGTVAASGGYWISAEADKIFSNNTTLTGSIGVFSMIPSLENTFKNKLHVTPVTIKSNDNADLYNMTRSINKREKEVTYEMIEDIYDNFITIVANGRDMSKEDVDNIAQGRVWCGNEALEIGLVDEIGGLKDAVDYAAIAAGIESYRIAEYPKPANPLDKFMESFGGASTVFDITTADPETIIESLYSTLESQTGVQARLPYIYHIDM